MRILLLEDNETDAGLTIRALKKYQPGCKIEHAETIERAKNILYGKMKFDVALLDMQLPDGNGMDILLMIRHAGADMAVVMFTGSGDEEVATAALKAGADDYMVKQPDFTTKIPQAIEFAIKNHKQFQLRESNIIQVLYIEHNQVDVDLTRRYLNRYAPYIQINNALTGEEALRILPLTQKSPREWKHQVVVMDYRLPGISALEIIKEIREERKLDIPIIIVTGHGNEEVAAQALKVGADEYLVKRENYLNRLPSLISGAFEHCELKRKQKALRESEAKYRLLAENSGDMIFTLDFDLNYTYVSPAIQTLRGFTPEEVMNHKISDALTPASYNFVMKTIKRILPDIKKRSVPVKPMVVELEMYKKDGATAWFEVKVSVSTDEYGKPNGILGVSRDVSKRKAVQEELKKLSRAVTQSPDSIIITDKKGRIEYVNPKFTQLTGYEEKEVLGKNPHILNSGKQSKSFYEKLWNSILAGNDWQGEFLNKKKNGEVYWESANISPLLNEAGEITHFVAVKEDITNRKKTEKLFRYESELRQILLKIASKYINVRPEKLEQSIIESLEEMGRFARADRTYIFEYDWTNQSTTNTHEWCAENITSQQDKLQQIPLDKLSFWTKKHLKGEEIFISDVNSLPEQSSLRKGLEKQKIKSLIALPMMNDKKCIGFVGFDWVKNYHAYTEGEQTLLSIFSQMLVNVKTRVTLEETLTIEKDRAEAANRLKTAFLNNISHEVRTPLNGILGFGEILTQPGLTEKEKELYLDILKKSSDRLTNTITDFMDISLIMSRNVKINNKYAPIDEILSSVYQKHAGTAKEKGLELLLIVDETEKSQLYTDPELLKKVLSHLIDNAIKFTKKGKIELRLITKNNQVEFHVSDEGVGIDKEKFDSIFDLFTQGEIGLTRGYEGSGLGLSISKGLADMLGGKISIESKKMKGTTVKIIFKAEETGKKQPSHKPDSISPLSSLVLVAEDDPVNSQYIQTVLSNANINSIVVGNGKKAVEACKSNPGIGLVLMDIKMPVMGGLEATRQIKAVMPKLPVIAVTAYAMKDDEQKFRESGYDDYISKPFSGSHLIARIKNYL